MWCTLNHGTVAASKRSEPQNTTNMIPDKVVEQILSLDIISVLEAEGLVLKKSGGGNYACCCPFHGEKTASFNVSATKNVYHCFGCGKSGNAITYIRETKGFTFPEALEYLADKNGIRYEKREMTPEEREAHFKKEQLININRAAHEFFVSKLGAPIAKNYIAKRGWNSKSVADFGVGYAPEGNVLLKHLHQLGWTDDKVLIESGVIRRSEVSGNLYDAFQGRLIFPIYSATGYISGFQGRDVTGKENAIKYINTSETPLFHKKEILFGLFQSQRKISTMETVILCEGNPDVIRLHQIGQEYAVAPMGTAFTEEHIEVLKRKRAKKVIICGDTDKAGLAAVEKQGEMLTKAGFSVRVMQLPEGKDPDEYFLSHSREWDDCLERNTLDYIPWFAKRRMDGKISQTEISAVIVDVAKLLAYCTDENAVEMYLDLFKKEYKCGALWRQEYGKACNERNRRLDKDEDSGKMMAEYGFYIKDGCYYGTGSAKDKRWSNFVFKPILHIRDEKNARRIFLMKNSSGQEAVIKFNQSELVSFASFKTRTESAGNFIWEGKEDDMTVLKKYLYDDTPSADEIKQLGWQKQWGFYAWGNGGFDEGTFVQADKFGIVDIKGQKFYLPGCSLDTKDNVYGYQQQRKFVYAVTNSITLNDYAARLITVFGDNAKVALCFLVATLFKDIITATTTSFPILNLFGPKGTGKSELGHSLTSFFIPNNKAPNINNTTKAALAEAVAEVSNAVVHLDEYKNNLDLEKREFLKGLWDGAGRSRMNMDNDKRRETTAVDCGVVMSGQEMPTADIALFNRLVFLTFNKTTFSDKEKQNYEELKLLERRGLTHLTGQILQLRSVFQGNFRISWDDALTDLNNAVRQYNVEDRTLKNWATLLAAFKSVESYLHFPFTYKDMVGMFAVMCVEQNNMTKQNNELSGFWEMVDILSSSGKIWIKVDYHIKYGNQKPVKIIQSEAPVELDPSKRYLFINYKRIATLYFKEGRDGGGKVIPKESLKYYLENSPEFCGTARSVRFRQIETPAGYTPNDPKAGKSNVGSAMIFDYDALRKNYDISLDVEDGYYEDTDEQSPAITAAPPSIFDELKEDE